MTKFKANSGMWVETGKKAANEGKRDALTATYTLFALLFDGLQVVIDNQFELYAAINKAENGRKP
jgi:hypothetical protein